MEKIRFLEHELIFSEHEFLSGSDDELIEQNFARVPPCPQTHWDMEEFRKAHTALDQQRFKSIKEAWLRLTNQLEASGSQWLSLTDRYVLAYDTFGSCFSVVAQSGPNRDVFSYMCPVRRCQNKLGGAHHCPDHGSLTELASESSSVESLELSEEHAGEEWLLVKSKKTTTSFDFALGVESSSSDEEFEQTSGENDSAEQVTVIKCSDSISTQEDNMPRDESIGIKRAEMSVRECFDPSLDSVKSNSSSDAINLKLRTWVESESSDEEDERTSGDNASAEQVTVIPCSDPTSIQGHQKPGDENIGMQRAKMSVLQCFDPSPDNIRSNSSSDAMNFKLWMKASYKSDESGEDIGALTVIRCSNPSSVDGNHGRKGSGKKPTIYVENNDIMSKSRSEVIDLSVESGLSPQEDGMNEGLGKQSAFFDESHGTTKNNKLRMMANMQLDPLIK